MRVCMVAPLALFIAIGCKSRSEQSSSKPAKATESEGYEATAEAISEPDQAHPLFPSPKAAGTDAIFSLEEPDRGPLVTEAPMPSGKGLRFTHHAHCDLEEHGLVCSPARSRPSSGWRVGRNQTLTVAIRYRAQRTRDAMLLEHDAAGKLTRVIMLRPDGVVDWSRSYSVPGERFSARMRSGANQLDGCGYMGLSLDARGRTESITCLQWLGKPMRDEHGVAITRLKRDRDGFVVEKTFFDPGGNPGERHDGVHSEKLVRDSSGRVIRRLVFARDGSPAVSAEAGCHAVARDYDAQGRIVADRCLDANGKPARGQREAATARYTYDRAGCQIGVQYFDVRGEPMDDSRGVHARSWKNDRWCRSVADICSNIRGKRVTCGVGNAAETRTTYDRKGNAVSERHYRADGKPGGDGAFGVFELRAEFDARGNEIKSSCFGPGGDAVECSRTGYHAEVRKLDDAGRVVESRYLDTAGKPTTNMGAAVTRYTYDNYDHLHEVQLLDEAGKPKVVRGMAKRRQLYDEGHRLFAVLLFDEHDQPARYAACYTGRRCPRTPWHAVRIVRSNRGDVIFNHYFDHQRKLLQTLDCTKEQCWGAQ